MSVKHINSLFLAAILGAGATSAWADSDAEVRRELEAARAELDAARAELERAARKLSETSHEMKRKEEFDRTFEFWTNPDRGMLGVIIGPGPLRDGQHYGTPILAVTPGSGADEAGLKAGDLIVDVDGKPVRHNPENPEPPEHALGGAMGVLKVGQKVKLGFERDGKLQRTKVVAKRPESFKGEAPFAFKHFFETSGCDEEVIGHQAWDRPVPPAAPAPTSVELIRPPKGLLGLELAAMNADLSDYFDTDHGVLVVTAPGDGTLRLKGGDVITRIEGRPVNDPRLALDQLRAVSRGKEVTVEVVRKGKRIKLQGTLPDVAWATMPDGNWEIIVKKMHRQQAPTPDGG